MIRIDNPMAEKILNKFKSADYSEATQRVQYKYFTAYMLTPQQRKDFKNIIGTIDVVCTHWDNKQDIFKQIKIPSNVNNH